MSEFSQADADDYVDNVLIPRLRDEGYDLAIRDAVALAFSLRLLQLPRQHDDTVGIEDGA